MENNDVLILQNVSFNYGKNQILKDFSLNVEKGSFTTLLGPSGCGKTTLLRLISGFLRPSSGKIFINGQNQENVPVNQRKVGIVFQDYALFPHLTVEKNILYGLKCAPKTEKAQTSKEMQQGLLHQMARMLALEGLLDRYPHQLSGGQQQRVALARSLILKPQILLMDEPLSSLDAKLRAQVRDELLEIQQKFGITTIYVTHDQEEAFSLSSKIAVINHGQKLQEGTSQNLYFEPQNRFVAEFTGRCNFLLLNGEDLANIENVPESEKTKANGVYLVRPEWFELAGGENSPKYQIEGKITGLSFMGGFTRLKIESEKTQNKYVLADINSANCPALTTGSHIKLRINHLHPMND